MSPEQFQEAISQLNRDSQARHEATQKRIDLFATGLRDGLRDDIGLMLKPVVDKVDSHGKKIEDHETRIRGLEKSGTKRDVVLGGAAGLMGGVAGFGMSGLIEAIKAAWKVKGGM